MTEKQIDKIKLKIKKQRAALVAEKRLYGGFHDGSGRRYYIADLYLQIADYKGALTYKKWFDKNFPNDNGDALMSLNWSIMYHGLDKIKEAEIHAIDTAFQNIFLHTLLLDRDVSQDDSYENGYDMLNFAKSMIEDCKKVITQPYLDWLSKFIDSDEYKKLINQFIAINKLLSDEKDIDERGELIEKVNDLIASNKNR